MRRNRLHVSSRLHTHHILWQPKSETAAMGGFVQFIRSIDSIINSDRKWVEYNHPRLGHVPREEHTGYEEGADDCSFCHKVLTNLSAILLTASTLSHLLPHKHTGINGDHTPPHKAIRIQGHHLQHIMLLSLLKGHKRLTKMVQEAGGPVTALLWWVSWPGSMSAPVRGLPS
ncbi:hypothetical protein ASPBRDRAFT_613382 [Aspergillus brasiliensis CBS 101740]|uniref:Uncharacterized protein n=1 Tax=Aspergillus brasiliensis (strain CBS 101740 / IMI 381727 / IBT 21946) TaxID=767769 RepID=A0A1L9UIJ9_ASPBC|nr:hypothetical protein ASPBRDRAFT_613382 [Aspergillus brasiliensis CBS 101740]